PRHPSLSPDGLVLSQSLAPLGCASAPHQDGCPSRSLPRLFWAAFTHSPARAVGSQSDLWICPAAIQCRKTRKAQRRADHLWPAALSQRRDFLYLGLWRHHTGIPFRAATGGNRSRHRIWISCHCDWLLADYLFRFFPSRDRDLAAGRTRRLASPCPRTVSSGPSLPPP